jgi:putative peptidoglycan lipid II flippase
VSMGRRGGLVRANVSVALGTAFSRVTGLVRVAALAWALGITVLADAYNLANSTPNIIYELLLGGVLSAALVPLFTRHLEEDDDDATSAIVTVSLLALAVVSIVAVLAAPAIIRVYQPAGSPGYDDTVFLARLILPEIFFYGFMAVGSAILNSRRRFFAPAWAPIVNNLVVIVVVITAGLIIRSEAETFLGFEADSAVLWILGAGTTLGIVLMALALVPSMRAANLHLRFLPQWRHPAVARLVRLSGWTIGYVAANQLSLVVVFRLARDTGVGGLTTFLYSVAFVQLPHGLLAVSIMTTFGPELARLAFRGDDRGFNRQVSLGLRMTALLIVPASVAYVVMGRPLVSVLLERGLLRGPSAALLADTLSAMALGLLGYSAYLFVLRCFYARTDARTPFFVNVYENAAMVVLGVPLTARYGVQGLGFSFALAYSSAAVIAFVVLVRRVPGFNVPLLTSSLFRFLLAGLLMAEVTYLASRAVGSDQGWGALLRASAGGLAGLAAYGAVLVFLRAPELDALRRLVPRRPAAA